jgi:acyl carrier protein
MDTLRAITDIATQQLGNEGAAIDVDAPIAQLGVDSLGFLELLFELEDHVGVPIPPESVKDANTLRELAARVDAIVANGVTTTRTEPATE